MRSAITILQTKRNAILRSAAMEQIEIPLLQGGESPRESDAAAMEVESDVAESSQGFSQQYTQRLEMAIDEDDAMMERIDFSKCSKPTDVDI